MNIVLSREDIASIVGTATETVIRLLSEFKQDDYISLEGKKIRVLDTKALAKNRRLLRINKIFLNQKSKKKLKSMVGE